MKFNIILTWINALLQSQLLLHFLWIFFVVIAFEQNEFRKWITIFSFSTPVMLSLNQVCSIFDGNSQMKNDADSLAKFSKWMMNHTHTHEVKRILRQCIQQMVYYSNCHKSVLGGKKSFPVRPEKSVSSILAKNEEDPYHV